MVLFGIVAEKLIGNHYKVVSSGIVGLTIFYFGFITFVLPKNEAKKPLELEDLEFPRDLGYLFVGFFRSMIFYWAGNLVIELIRYLLTGS